MANTNNARNKVSHLKKVLGTTILLVGITTIIVSCGIFSNRFGPTPDISNVGVRPYLAVGMPFTWDCEVITNVLPGYSWNGIQVGKTTYDEMVDILRPELIYRTTSLDRVVFEMGDHVWNNHRETLSACFKGNLLSALEFYGNSEEFPSDLLDLIVLYGVPDRVTWGHNAANRTMVWAEEGLMVNIELFME